MTRTALKEKPIVSAPKVEMFYTLVKAKGTAIVLYLVQETLVENGQIKSQRNISEPDIKDISMSKMLGLVERTLR